MNDRLRSSHVAIVGGGPSGLAAATELCRLGVGQVTVLDRESSAGGIPRHCGHPPFGLREFRRMLKGPEYAQRLVAAARDAGVEIRPNTTATCINPGPSLQLTSPGGVDELAADRILLATGVRETPRSARLISGTRPLGVMTTGALQSMVYLKNRRPCLRPVIVGSELVAFSALLTCRHGGIRPVAMVESGDRITARRWSAALPRFQGIPLMTGTRVVGIEGDERVTGILLADRDDRIQHLACDGVILTGRFTAESSLARMGHLAMDEASSGPEVDQFGRCSDAAFFATGNLLHPADSAGFCWREGVTTAGHIARDLCGELPPPETSIRIKISSPIIRYSAPQRLVPELKRQPHVPIGIRFAEVAMGRLYASSHDGEIASRRYRVLPEQRRSLRIPLRMLQDSGDTIEIGFDT